MYSPIKKYVRLCPQSGKFLGFKDLKIIPRFFVPFIGFAALLWIIFRIAAKPSRLAYPCVRTAIPLASSLLGYVVTAFLGALAWAHTRKRQIQSTFTFALAFGLAGFGGSMAFIGHPEQTKFQTVILTPNQPMGTAVGIFPGRVVWVHRSDATNQNCNPVASGHEWYRPENNNQPAVDSMVSTAIRGLTGSTDDASSWSAIFHFHNSLRGKGDVGYAAGEKIFIKINATSSWNGNFNPTDLTQSTTSSYPGISETSPAIVLSVLRELVNVAGVSQNDIYIGDPMKHIYKNSYDLWHNEFPNAHYLDVSGYTQLGREKVAVSKSANIQYSDRGTVLQENGTSGGPVRYDSLYTIFEDAEYILNIPMLKGHLRAGATMFAKNNFGSNTQSDASHLHSGLVAPDGSAATRTGYGLYRVQVDLMGHKLLGMKQLFFLMDALWATDFELDHPLKWKMAPFNNEWMSSIFASLDPVAIESVGYDFLRTEFTPDRGASTCVQMEGVDDYLHQAADSANWPKGIKYDPENDGTILGSLGTHEHWNDGVHKQYSRNLNTGKGIELVTVDNLVSVKQDQPETPGQFCLHQNYPNPFNPSTTISYDLPFRSHVRIDIFNSLGQRVAELVNAEMGAAHHSVLWKADVSSGFYFYRIEAISAMDHSKRFLETKKMQLMK